MAKCSHCGQIWNEPNGDFPNCNNNNCPLHELRDHMLCDRIGRNNFFFLPDNPSTDNNTKNCVTLQSGSIQNSLNFLRSSCTTQFQPYNMEGSQSASTTVVLCDGTKKSFKTNQLMHSEMAAIKWMLEEKHWTVFVGLVVWTHNGEKVTLQQFQTEEPHCGFCTLFLIAAGLPVGKPTRGNFKLASRCAFILPPELEISPHFIARVLDNGKYCGFAALKRVLNAFVKVPAERWVLSIGGLAYVDDNCYVGIPDPQLLVVDWYVLAEQHDRKIIYLVWKVIYEQLVKTNKEKK